MDGWEQSSLVMPGGGVLGPCPSLAPLSSLSREPCVQVGSSAPLIFLCCLPLSCWPVIYPRPSRPSWSPRPSRASGCLRSSGNLRF